MSDKQTTDLEHRYMAKAKRLIGERIDDARKQFDDLWVGALIGGGTAIGNMEFNPITRDLCIHYFNPTYGEVTVEVFSDLGVIDHDD